MKKWLKRKLSRRQWEIGRLISYEFKRFRLRMTSPKSFKTDKTLFHLGCGDRHLANWLNVDLWNSDINLDIANGVLPFADHQFEAVVSQHVIEHLTIEDELIPLLKECYRTMKPGGEIWLSTPDMEKVAKSYINHQNEDMVADRQKRLPHWNLGVMPSQHFMNDMFHQELEHRNLFDLGLLTWTLNQAGFMQVERTDEHALLTRFPEFPPRNDDYQSIYVKAVK